MGYRIIHGDNREILKTLESNSVDAIVTDPPYGIDFLKKDWDANTGALETYKECLRVLKKGGHILAFSAPRTYHYLAMTLEQSGFEIRDQIMWVYSSGFPHSQDVGRQIHKREHGKPDKQRFDPSVLTKVPSEDRISLYQHNETGKIYRALPDINGDRLAVSMEGSKYGTIYEEVIEVNNKWSGWGTQLKPAHEPICLARKPAKGSFSRVVEKWGTGALNIDATRIKDEGEKQGRFPSNVIGEISNYQKYFFLPKVTKKERHIGFDGEGNNHPTVKPVSLMEYLVTLITPPNGTVLDPFNGSGSTGMAVAGLGFNYIGIEIDKKYCEISERRIQAWLSSGDLFREGATE